MGNHQKVRVKLTNNQLKKLESVSKNETGITSRMTKKKTFKMKNCCINYL